MKQVLFYFEFSKLFTIFTCNLKNKSYGKKLSEHDLTMIIYARKHLDDALHGIDYGEFEEEAKQRIREAMDWLTELKVRLAQ